MQEWKRRAGSMRGIPLHGNVLCSQKDKKTEIDLWLIYPPWAVNTATGPSVPAAPATGEKCNDTIRKHSGGVHGRLSGRKILENSFFVVFF